MTMTMPLAEMLEPLGYARFEYRIAEELDFREGNLFKIWYNLLRPDEKTFWHTFMMKAQQKIEYRWDDFLAEKNAGKIAVGEPYDPVVNFDPRFHYYDQYVDIVGFLPEKPSRKDEEAKVAIWELEEQDLELSMAMDPESFAAKAMNPKKRKPDPETEGEDVSRHPIAKRKPDGSTETPMASASASPSVSQEPPTAEMETPSDSHSRSASGVLEPPRARPTHTPKTPGDGTDEEVRGDAQNQHKNLYELARQMALLQTRLQEISGEISRVSRSPMVPSLQHDKQVFPNCCHPRVRKHGTPSIQCALHC